MPTILALLIGVFALGPTPPVVPASPVKLDKGPAESLVKEIEKDRADTDEWLRSKPTSYLATILRRDFGDKRALRVGRSADNDVRLDDPAVAPHHVRITIDGDS